MQVPEQSGPSEASIRGGQYARAHLSGMDGLSPRQQQVTSGGLPAPCRRHPLLSHHCHRTARHLDFLHYREVTEGG